MKPLFLISSALHTKHGIFSAEQRLSQTILTLESIKDKIPNARILIIESSAEASITEDETKTLEPLVEGILNFNPDQQVQEIYQTGGDNWDIVKNITELTVYGKALDFIVRQQPQILDDVSRVFKLSGRYILNNDFDLQKHLAPEAQDKYIFATRRISQFPAIVTDGLTHQFFSRLWSWPVQKTALVFFRYNVMLEHAIGLLGQKKYGDIEHLLFKYFSGPYVKELTTIGVEGQIGPNGAQVKD